MIIFYTMKIKYFSAIEQFNNFYIDICWDLLSVCNLKCPYCYARKQYKDYIIQNKKQIDIIINKLKKINYNFHCGLLGGEPTLHPYLVYILDELYKIKNCTKIKLITNGTKKISHVNSKLEINFSLHPSQDNFNQIYNNIINLNSNNFNNIIVYLLMQNNKFNLLNKYYLELNKLKCNIRHEYIINNDKVHFTKPLFKEYKNYTDTFKQYSFREAYNISFKNYICKLSHFRIMANGDVYRECIDDKMGNIFKHDLSFEPLNYICDKDYCHDDFLLEIPKYEKL